MGLWSKTFALSHRKFVSRRPKPREFIIVSEVTIFATFLQSCFSASYPPDAGPRPIPFYVGARSFECHIHQFVLGDEFDGDV